VNLLAPRVLAPDIYYAHNVINNNKKKNSSGWMGPWGTGAGTPGVGPAA
jgi:hypothetical protein